MSKEADKSTKPLCWSCKHGICVKQTSFDLVPQMPEMPSPETTIEEPWQKGEQESKDPAKNFIEVTVTKYMTVCYWCPAKAGAKGIPIQFDLVTECSRYEKNSG
jgi:hypothetical protein